MTELVFREDAYAEACEATVTAVDETAVYFDRTVFYPAGGGQPGDTGVFVTADGARHAVVDTRKSSDATPETVAHIFDSNAPPSPGLIGQTVRLELDWTRRYSHMRIHTLLHLLSAVIPAGVTGGSIRDGSGRLDFDLPEASLDKEQIAAALNRLIEEDHAVGSRWISDEELAARPELVKTMSVKPPTGAGQVRLLDIPGIDLQPCGGTHVARTGEIGPVIVKKIEKKGKHNRRVNVAFAPT